jgi:hypothetical protein
VLKPLHSCTVQAERRKKAGGKWSARGQPQVPAGQAWGASEHIQQGLRRYLNGDRAGRHRLYVTQSVREAARPAGVPAAMPLAASLPLPLPLKRCKLTLAWPLHSQGLAAGSRMPARHSAARAYAAAALNFPLRRKSRRYCSCVGRETHRQAGVRVAAGELCLYPAAEVLW